MLPPRMPAKVASHTVLRTEHVSPIHMAAGHAQDYSIKAVYGYTRESTVEHKLLCLSFHHADQAPATSQSSTHVI